MTEVPASPALVADGPAAVVTDAGTVASRGPLVSVAMAMVGVLGYVGSLLLAHLLDAAEFRDYAAAQMLVGMVGTFAGAMIPMPVADVVRAHPAGSEGRRQGMAFACAVCAACGAVAALMTGLLTAAFAPPTVVVAVVVSAPMLFVLSPVLGWLQGELRFLRFGVVSVLEVVARVVFSTGAVLVGLRSGGAVTGFAVGVVVVLFMTPRALFRDLAWRPGAMREKARWSETGGIAVAQLVVSAIVGADVVVVALLHAEPVASAGYQALATLAKGPAYVAAGAAVVAFPLLRGAGADVHEILRATLRSFALLAFPAAAVVATVPSGLVLLAIPHRYAGSLHLLPVLALAGVGYAGLSLFATLMVALRAYRRCRAGLLVALAVVPAGMVLGWHLGRVPGLAAGVAAGALASAAALWIAAGPCLPPGTLRRVFLGMGLAAALVGVLVGVARLPALWVACVVLLGGAVFRFSRRGSASS